MTKHKIAFDVCVPAVFDGEEWDASDQAFGQPLNTTGYAFRCGSARVPHATGGDCLRAAEASDNHPLDAWELTQMLARAHGAVVIPARALERLRALAINSDDSAERWEEVTDDDSNDDVEEAGAEAVGIHGRMAEVLRGLDGFRPASGNSIQAAFKRQQGPRA